MTLQTEKPLAYAKIQKYNEMIEAGKSIAIIQLQYSYACNFHCSHCSILNFRTQSGRMLDVEKVKDISKQADEYGLAQWGLSGGEPLVFRELPELIEALMPDRFHIQMDTNGWLMTKQKAKFVKSLGVDKIQISIDGMDAELHDSFRRKPGSHARCIRAMEAVKEAGMQLQIATVVDHERANSEELERFFEFCQINGGAPSVVYAKPVGEWAGRTDVLCTQSDINHVKILLEKYGGYDHTTPQYGIDFGCLAVKRMISITGFGDVLPCPWMYFSLGNVFDEPLSDILDKGMRYFKDRSPVCRVSESKEFQKNVLSKLDGLSLPKIEEVM
jgi:MoaA/NifB/PqqE/SkfB family radical SAM enzyme